MRLHEFFRIEKQTSNRLAYSVSLSNKHITENGLIVEHGLAQLKQLRGLAELHLSGTKISDDGLRRKLGTDAVPRAQEFTWQAYRDRHFEIYRDLLGITP